MKTKLDKLIRFALLAPFVAAMVIHGSTKPTPGPVFSFDNTYIGDGGSYATNDTVHVALTRRIMELPIDDCDVIAYMRERGSTNAADYVVMPTYKFGEYPVDFAVQNATNYNYWFYLDYVPPSPVHTNGVFELRGFEVAGEPRVPNPIFSAGFAQSAIVDNREIVPIEYLESTGTQWINSGVMSEYPKIHAGLWYDRYRTAYTRFFGNYSDEQHNCIRLILQTSANDRAWVTPGTKAGGSINVPFAKSEWHNVYLDCTAKSCTIDGELFTTPNVGTRYVNNICIFADNRGPSANAVIRISFFKIWDDNGVLVRDFQPVRVGRVGYMFDRVSGEYLPFGNAGTGAFILGPDIKE